MIDTRCESGHNGARLGTDWYGSGQETAMVDLTLRGQYELAVQHAAGGDLATAVQTCRRILETYPKHVGSYAVMGQICLQLGERRLAANLFRRVLSANPEHALSYASLGAIYEERGLLDEATWQYQRAHELSPRNAAIRESLQRLYAEHSLRAAQRVMMTASALARTYLRGQLYGKAISELRRILLGEPHRLDLRVALAEALWRSGKADEAQAVCQGILNELPNCLKANLILGHIWLNTEHDTEARRLLQETQALDPENATAQALFGSRSPLPPKIVRLPFREQDIEPLDLPYLIDDDEAVAESMVVDAESRAEVSGAPVQPAIAELPLPKETADPEPPGIPRGPRRSLLQAQRDYVKEHPGDLAARLTLARHYRDIGDVTRALEQYAHLVQDAADLSVVIHDLRTLNTLRPGNMGLISLLVIAQETAGQHQAEC